MEPQIVLKVDNNHTLKASNFKNFLGACPQTPLEVCDYRTSVLMSTPIIFTLIPYVHGCSLVLPVSDFQLVTSMSFGGRFCMNRNGGEGGR